MAVALLFLIALVCAAATICETKYGVQVARARFYDAPWFAGVLGLVALNLLCATWVRWPWRRRDLWFVAVHYGIVILMGGAFLGRQFGSETFLRLHTPELVNETQIVFAQRAPVVVQHSGVPSGFEVSLSTEKNDFRVVIHGRSVEAAGFALFPALGKTVQIPGSPLQIAVQKYWPDFAMAGNQPISRSEAPNNPAVQLHVTGSLGSVPGESVAAIARSVGVRVDLIRFEVPRDQATGALADFRSTVAFTDIATGQTNESVISSNHPVHYPGGFWRTALGLNAQFSQAGWNPEDPGETTLQVSRDPGWPLKCLGSLLVSLGVAGLLFRWPARRNL